MKKLILITFIFSTVSCDNEIEKEKKEEIVKMIEQVVIDGYRYRVIEIQGERYIESGLSKTMTKLK